MTNENTCFTPIDKALMESRIVFISGVVDSELAHDVNRQLLALEKHDAEAPIYLYINSPGGEISSGFAIYDMARFVTPPVFTLVCGLAASMGSLIALCAPSENRMALSNSKFLIHQPLISGTLRGPATDIDIQARDLLRTKEKINIIYATATGKDLSEIVQTTDRDRWMTAEEALEFGLISRVVESRNDIG